MAYLPAFNIDHCPNGVPIEAVVFEADGVAVGAAGDGPGGREDRPPRCSPLFDVHPAVDRHPLGALEDRLIDRFGELRHVGQKLHRHGLERRLFRIVTARHRGTYDGPFAAWVLATIRSW